MRFVEEQLIWSDATRGSGSGAP